MPRNFYKQVPPRWNTWHTLQSTSACNPGQNGDTHKLCVSSFKAVFDFWFIVFGFYSDSFPTQPEPADLNCFHSLVTQSPAEPNPIFLLKSSAWQLFWFRCGFHLMQILSASRSQTEAFELLFGQELDTLVATIVQQISGEWKEVTAAAKSCSSIQFTSSLIYRLTGYRQSCMAGSDSNGKCIQDQICKGRLKTKKLFSEFPQMHQKRWLVLCLNLFQVVPQWCTGSVNHHRRALSCLS